MYTYIHIYIYIYIWHTYTHDQHTGVTNMIAKHGCCLSIHEQAHVDWWYLLCQLYNESRTYRHLRIFIYLGIHLRIFIYLYWLGVRVEHRMDMRHITCRNESCKCKKKKNESCKCLSWVCGVYEWVMLSRRCMSHVTHMNQSCYTDGWVMSHVWISHVTCMDESCHTHERVMSHTWTSHVTRQESRHIYGWVTSHIWMSHVVSRVYQCSLMVHTFTYTQTHTRTPIIMYTCIYTHLLTYVHV